MKRMIVSADKSIDIFRKIEEYAYSYAKDPYDIVNKLIQYARKYKTNKNKVLKFMLSPKFHELVGQFYSRGWNIPTDQDIDEDIQLFYQQVNDSLK